MAKQNKAEVYNDTGDLQGLWTIDGKKARGEFGDARFWEGVERIVTLYKEINPADFQAAVDHNAATKLDNINEFGSNKSKSFRQALQLPHGLYVALIDYEPRMFREKKKREEFMKRFEGLRSCNKI